MPPTYNACSQGLDEAREIFGDQIRGRQVPLTRDQMNAEGPNVPPPRANRQNSGNRSPQNIAPQGFEAPPPRRARRNPGNPPLHDDSVRVDPVRPTFRLSGRSRTQGGISQHQVVSDSGSLWVQESGLAALGLVPPARASIPLAPGPSVSAPTAIISISGDVVTVRKNNGELGVISLSAATEKHAALVSLYLIQKNQASVTDLKEHNGNIVYRVGSEWKSANEVSASAIQSFLQRRARGEEKAPPAAAESPSDPKYDDMSFPYEVSGNQHSLFSSPNAFDPRGQWQLWPSKFRKAYHTQSPMVLAAWSKVHVLQGSLSMKPPKLERGLRIEMTSKEIAWSSIDKVEATAELPSPVFWNLLKRRNIMDLHCYHGWRPDWLQDVLEFEAQLLNLNCICGMAAVKKIYDLVMMRRSEMGFQTKYAELVKMTMNHQPQLFFPPPEYDSHLPDWNLQRKRKRPSDEGSKKVENCRFFLQGYCRNGAKCRKLHDARLSKKGNP
eukprot:CAMPEP_0197541822 /NCGR_PEP_ID=MMETSP1318-20131121/67369_1 /TAXON_ID=552666 /ORGANISM="Partenskyella glossopodia, Strain RCC365" /LENGTH=496 /DNA_ID=CAMNT_0043101031 /DNA_START=714 /DNA_END=2200 /DNA_ORIENTATION=+